MDGTIPRHQLGYVLGRIAELLAEYGLAAAPDCLSCALYLATWTESRMGKSMAFNLRHAGYDL